MRFDRASTSWGLATHEEAIAAAAIDRQMSPFERYTDV
jgi:hypothetical protein